MTYPLIEQEIVQQLVPIRTEFGVLVQGLPELSNKWGAVAGQGWVSIRWDATEQDRYSLGEMTAEEIVTYHLDVRVKELRGEKGLYAVLNRLTRLLWGFQPTMCITPLRLGTFNFLGTAEDYWVAQGLISSRILAGINQQVVYSEILLIDPDTDTLNRLNPDLQVINY